MLSPTDLACRRQIADASLTGTPNRFPRRGAQHLAKLGRSVAPMGSIWVESLGRNFDAALDLLADAVRDCTDELWETSMWDVPAPDANYELRGPDGRAVTEPMERRALVQRWSAPWSVAWHVLECFDYDLNGDLAPWTPPDPFAGKPHWRFWSSVPPWSRTEIVGYLDYCRQRARDTLAGVTEEKAATPLPPSHRYRGQPYAWVITSLVGHTTEHGSQIRQFITAAGVGRGTQGQIEGGTALATK